MNEPNAVAVARRLLCAEDKYSLHYAEVARVCTALIAADERARAQAQEMAELRADRDSWADQANERVKDAVQFIADRDAALRRAEADAERYRWLRQRLYSLDFDYSDNHANVLVFESPGGALGPGLALDAAIDRARTQGGDRG